MVMGTPEHVMWRFLPTVLPGPLRIPRRVSRLASVCGRGHHGCNLQDDLQAVAERKPTSHSEQMKPAAKFARRLVVDRHGAERPSLLPKGGGPRRSASPQPGTVPERRWASRASAKALRLAGRVVGVAKIAVCMRGGGGDRLPLSGGHPHGPHIDDLLAAVHVTSW